MRSFRYHPHSHPVIGYNFPDVIKFYQQEIPEQFHYEDLYDSRTGAKLAPRRIIDSHRSYKLVFDGKDFSAKHEDEFIRAFLQKYFSHVCIEVKPENPEDPWHRILTPFQRRFYPHLFKVERVDDEPFSNGNEEHWIIGFLLNDRNLDFIFQQLITGLPKIKEAAHNIPELKNELRDYFLDSPEIFSGDI